MIRNLYYRPYIIGWVCKLPHAYHDILKWHRSKHVPLHVTVYPIQWHGSSMVHHAWYSVVNHTIYHTLTWFTTCYMIFTWHHRSKCVDTNPSVYSLARLHMSCSATETCMVHHKSSYFTCGQRQLDRHMIHDGQK